MKDLLERVRELQSHVQTNSGEHCIKLLETLDKNNARVREEVALWSKMHLKDKRDLYGQFHRGKPAVFRRMAGINTEPFCSLLQ